MERNEKKCKSVSEYYTCIHIYLTHISLGWEFLLSWQITSIWNFLLKYVLTKVQTRV